MKRIAIAVLGLVSASASAQELDLKEAERLLVEQTHHAAAAYRQVYWTGETAPIYLSVASEIQDPATVDAGWDWIRYSCSADGPKNIRIDDWYLKLEFILFDVVGQVIYVSAQDDSTYSGSTVRRAGGLCAFDGLDTWLEDDLIDHGFLAFPEDLEPARVLVYVSPEETSPVELLTSTAATLHRPENLGIPMIDFLPADRRATERLFIAPSQGIIPPDTEYPDMFRLPYVCVTVGVSRTQWSTALEILIVDSRGQLVFASETTEEDDGGWCDYTGQPDVYAGWFSIPASVFNGARGELVPARTAVIYISSADDSPAVLGASPPE